MTPLISSSMLPGWLMRANRALLKLSSTCWEVMGGGPYPSSCRPWNSWYKGWVSKETVSTGDLYTTVRRYWVPLPKQLKQSSWIIITKQKPSTFTWKALLFCFKQLFLMLMITHVPKSYCTLLSLSLSLSLSLRLILYFFIHLNKYNHFLRASSYWSKHIS